MRTFKHLILAVLIAVCGNALACTNFLIIRGTLNGHEWVDLGLPSGTLWATCNVGATCPEEFGDYFAWGETEPQDSNAYNFSSYKYANGNYWGNPKITKYCNKSRYGDKGFCDTIICLSREDDAAAANWGKGWRMPTKEELKELKDFCEWNWTNQNGVDGLVFKAPNGNSIFLPATGYRCDRAICHKGNNCFYWSSTLHKGYPYSAWGLYLFSLKEIPKPEVYNSNRCNGFAVRPVCSRRHCDTVD